jgi:DNA topoisomerase-1
LATLSRLLTFSRSGKEVDLPPAAEEVAGFYAAMLETEHAQDATFNKNFFEDWKTLMKQHAPVRSLSHALEKYMILTN